LLRLDRAAHRGVDDNARADRVYPDTVRRHLACQCLGQPDDRKFAGAVAGKKGIAGLSRPGREVDDRTRALRNHVRQHGAADDENTFDVDPQHRLQCLERHFQRRPRPGNAGIVDQQVDPGKPLEHPIDRAADLARPRHIGGYRETADLRCRRFRNRAITVEHRHGHALVREPPSDCAPDAAAGARHQADPAMQRVHEHLLLVAPPR
jgi:hypothetical protein